MPHRPENRVGLQPPESRVRGRRPAGKGVPGEVRRRSRASGDDDLDGQHARVRGMSRSQVRSVQGQGLLRDEGVLCRHQRERSRRDGGGRNGPDAWGVKLQLATPEQKRQLEAINARAAEARRRLAERTAPLADQRRGGSRRRSSGYERGELRWQFHTSGRAAAEGATLTVHDDLGNQGRQSAAVQSKAGDRPDRGVGT